MWGAGGGQIWIIHAIKRVIPMSTTTRLAPPDEHEMLRALTVRIHRRHRRLTELDGKAGGEAARQALDIDAEIRALRCNLRGDEITLAGILGRDYQPPGVWPSRLVRTRGW